MSPLSARLASVPVVAIAANALSAGSVGRTRQAEEDASARRPARSSAVQQSILWIGLGTLAVILPVSLCRGETEQTISDVNERPLPDKSAARARAKTDFDPLGCRWTFGNHEPLSMYRRIGRRSTGGIEGGAHGLEDWHHWFDGERCTRTMQELGLNMLHSRFYKGMGWQFESQDFPNVKRFVQNCHEHGVRALAYVQFSTLYYEVMLAEIPDLAEWAAVDENGRKQTYHGGQYWRWLPCINAPGFEPYLKKVIRIALEEGDFDGIMLDNCPVRPCYCPRCTELFRKHLKQEPNPEARFGIPTVDHVLPPTRSGYGEAQDPIYQEWVLFRCERQTALFRRLYEFSKSCKPSALVTGNVGCIRRSNMAATAGLSISDLGTCFDVFVSQSGNEPGLRDGCIVNRVREMKLAESLNTHILALSDSDAGITREAESKYVLNLMENAVFGGIPTDRTIMSPDKQQMVSRQLIEFRGPLLRRFNDAVRSGRASLEKPTYAPVRILYSAESVMFSEQAYRAILSAEEILLRNHVPHGLLPTDRKTPLEVPRDCEVMLVANQTCLSDRQLAVLVGFVERGGRLVVTGHSGEYDERYRERLANPLKILDGRPGAIRREEVDVVRILGSGWTIKVASPEDGGRRLMADVNSLWRPAIRIEAPTTVLTEIKRGDDGFSVHFLNYASGHVPEGVRIVLHGDVVGPVQCTFAAPMEGLETTAIPVAPDAQGQHVSLPQFADYAVVDLRITTQ